MGCVNHPSTSLLSEPWQGHAPALSAWLYALFFRPPGQPSPLLAFWGREVHQYCSMFQWITIPSSGYGLFFSFWHHHGESETQRWRCNMKREREKEGGNKTEEKKTVDRWRDGHPDWETERKRGMLTHQINRTSAVLLKFYFSTSDWSPLGHSSDMSTPSLNIM